MIHKIIFNNFYSFLNKQEISFVAKRKQSYTYKKSSKTNYITKFATFIGSNASGKTNIMRLLSFLSYFICQSSKTESFVGYDMGYKTFFNNNKPSTFFLEFEVDNNTYFYELIAKNQKVQQESLYFKSKNINSRKKYIFIRNKKIKLNPIFFSSLSSKFLQNIRPDVSIIAFIKMHYSIDIINTVFNYFANFKTNINEKGQILHSHLIADQTKILNKYLSNPKLKKQVEKLIFMFDTGLSSFNISKNIVGDNRELLIEGKHSTKNSKIKTLNFIYESSGTKALFFLLSYILEGLKNNSVIIIDEFETGLHPEAVIQLLSYIIDENETTKAQIVFTTHSLGVMRKLDMHQVYLVEKNIESVSNVHRLNETQNIRSDENFLSKYMTGAYGGFPDIDLLKDEA